MTACSHREIRARVRQLIRSGMSNKPSQDGPSWNQLLGLGFSIAALVVVGTALGWFVDTRLHTFPTFVLVGVALGISTAVLYAYAQFRKFLEK
jgi:F0F1-type ATP synthase assembly protein I